MPGYTELHLSPEGAERLLWMAQTYPKLVSDVIGNERRLNAIQRQVVKEGNAVVRLQGDVDGLLEIFNNTEKFDDLVAQSNVRLAEQQKERWRKQLADETANERAIALSNAIAQQTQEKLAAQNQRMKNLIGWPIVAGVCFLVGCGVWWGLDQTSKTVKSINSGEGILPIVIPIENALDAIATATPTLKISPIPLPTLKSTREVPTKVPTAVRMTLTFTMLPEDLKYDAPATRAMQRTLGRPLTPKEVNCIQTGVVAARAAKESFAAGTTHTIPCP